MSKTDFSSFYFLAFPTLKMSSFFFILILVTTRVILESKQKVGKALHQRPATAVERTAQAMIPLLLLSRGEENLLTKLIMMIREAKNKRFSDILPIFRMYSFPLSLSVISIRSVVHSFKLWERPTNRTLIFCIGNFSRAWKEI